MSIKRQYLVALVMIIFAIIYRLLPHPANVTPLAAITLLSAIYLNKKLAIAVPILSLLISDLSLGFYGPVMLAVYGGFAITALLGFWARKNVNTTKIIVSTFISALIFYLLTNFAVWNFDGLYPKTLAGLWLCYVAALPFFRNSLAGDFFFTGIIFSLHYFLNKKSINLTGQSQTELNSPTSSKLI